MKVTFLFALIVLFGVICWGCRKYAPQGKLPNSQSTWKRYKTLEELWPHIKNEKVESVSLCDEDPDAGVESWYVLEKIPNDHIEEFLEFLRGEVESDIEPVPAQYRFHWPCQGVFKFITDNGEYIAPLDENVSQDNWQERVTLVGLWPRLQKEKIEQISFCDTIYRTPIDSWPCWNAPKENLDECIKIIANTMRNADPNNFDAMAVNEGRMKIVTNRAKYLVRAEVTVRNSTEATVFGNEWSSPELGAFIMKHGYPSHK
jgi:hypothetical protein